MGRTRYRVLDSRYPHLLTATVVEWMPVLARKEMGDIIQSSLKFMVKNGRMRIHAYVVMKDHLHFIASSDQLAKEAGLFKSFVARSILNTFESRCEKYWLEQFKCYKDWQKKRQKYQLWQEGSHPKCIMTPAMFRQKLAYVHMNPVKKGYCRTPEDWAYSSAGSDSVPVVPFEF